MALEARKGGEFERLLNEIEGIYDDEPVAKSFHVVIDGKKVEAIDGTEIVQELTARVEDQEFAVTKALGQILDVIKAQATQLAKLAKARKSKAPSMSHIEFYSRAMSAMGEGKISGLDIAKAETCLNHGRPVPPEIVRRVIGDSSATATEVPRAMSSGAFLSKALSSQIAGKVSGFEIAKAESAVNRGRPIDPAFVRKVLIGNSGVLA
ncbi:MAG TPA: hypothetical protein VHT51_15590 [Micropepsaceae bacterium]|nr:hypothetical protein [Micropepsaceae bacterium]